MTEKREKDPIRQTLILHMAELLQIPANQLDPSASFLEQGADSIVLVEAIRRIENSYGVQVSMQQIFEEFTSIDKLSTHLAENAAAPEPQVAQDAPETNSSITARIDRLSNPFQPQENNGTIHLMQAQLQLVKHTIEQQNKFLAARQV